MLIKVVVIGISFVVLNLFLKQYKPEFVVLINICAGLLIFSMVLKESENIIASLICSETLMVKDDVALKPILKVVGVGYITEFVSDLAEESGNKSLAGKIVFGGKVAICSLALPAIKNLINTILSLF